MRTPQLDQNGLLKDEPHWFAVYTRYKREKLIDKRLQEKGIETYLPLQRVIRRYKRKTRVVELPLIGCYLFTKITKKEYVPVLETPDVVQFVKFANDMVAIPDREILLMQRIVGERIEVEVGPAGYRVGDEVEIISGKLTGIRGILMEQNNPKNFLVELTHTGYSLRMQINPAQLQRVSAL